ncbi:MAG: hypothetical protein JNM14_07600 [Ferruginibacter sp.]|nr:hypothetical protein [Ferruginibacter sp.]
MQKSELKPDHVAEDLHVVRWQLIFFTTALVLPFIIFPLVHSEKLPEIIGKINDMLFVSGSILLAVKLAREGWDMAAAGYTILGIGWGILFAAIDFQSLHLDTEVRTSAAYFFLPSMILICFYKPFPWWIKVLTIACIIPFFVALLLQNNSEAHERPVHTWVLIGFNVFHLTSLFWGIFFFRQHKKQYKKNKRAVHRPGS